MGLESEARIAASHMPARCPAARRPLGEEVPDRPWNKVKSDGTGSAPDGDDDESLDVN